MPLLYTPVCVLDEEDCEGSDGLGSGAEPGGPRRVKCQSKRLSSSGVAVKSGDGEAVNSAASFTGIVC